HVFGAHVNGALEAEMRGNGGGGDAVLTRAGFSDDAGLAHFHREKTLADGVIDFVRAGVEKIFAFEIAARAAKIFRETFRELQRGGAPGEIFEQRGEVSLKGGVGFCEIVDRFEFEQRNHERFGDVAAAVRTETAWNGGSDDNLLCGHSEVRFENFSSALLNGSE